MITLLELLPKAESADLPPIPWTILTVGALLGRAGEVAQVLDLGRLPRRCCHQVEPAGRRARLPLRNGVARHQDLDRLRLIPPPSGRHGRHHRAGSRQSYEPSDAAARRPRLARPIRLLRSCHRWHRGVGSPGPGHEGGRRP
jgi:hypothetical protein